MKTWVLMLAGLMATAAPASAQNADVTGSWDTLVSTPQGTGPALALVLKKDGQKIVGTFATPEGVLPVEATVSGKAVTMTFTVPNQNGPVAVTFSGTVDGDAMKGTADFGGRAQGEWSAKRTAAAGTPAPAPSSANAPVDVTGAWAFAVTSAAGSGTPTITFKQTGEKLTGQYSGQLGEAPIAGTIKGTSIEFVIDIDLQGTALHIVYAGVADKTSMKGIVKLADLGEGTFTAARK